MIRQGAEDYLLVTLLAFAFSVAGTRLFLELTGYPQLGGGEIHIASAQEGDFIHVSVKDNGKGIKKEDQAKVLDEDTHFTTFGTNNEKGSGLGLMLCKDFVMQHDGKLWFESEEGKGTTFHFTMKVFNQES